MPFGFHIGRTYNRRDDIHGRFRGQPQGGIITPAGFPLVIIITGEEGLAHGYADRYRADGVFEYFGEGQHGDMELKRRNAAIAWHARDGKDLLLFRKLKDGLRFEGEMVYEAHHVEPAPDSTGAMRSAIVFELRPLESVREALEKTPTAGRDIAELRQLAWQSAVAVPRSSVVLVPCSSEAAMSEITFWRERPGTVRAAARRHPSSDLTVDLISSPTTSVA
jgi:5-methylcytosine-specific restriction protein A